jgi:hypothetical protein
VLIFVRLLNCDGDGVLSRKSALFERFSRRKDVGGGTRRQDSKGLRKKLSLRLADELLLKLQVIKIASGEDKSAFCERVLNAAVEQRMNELRSNHDANAWSTIVSCAKAGRG